MNALMTEVTTPGRTAAHSGSMSTEEIKIRIEAMFARGGDEPEYTSH